MRTARRRPARAVVAAVVVLLLAACGGTPEPDNGAAPAPVLPGAYDTADRQSKGFPAAVRPPDNEQHLLLDVVRTGDHPGYDRIVFAHSGDGLPGWRTEYVDQPVSPGSGHDITMAGDAYLAIYVTGLQPGMAGAEHGHAVVDTEWTGQRIAIAQTVTTAVFEGAASYFVSLDAQRAYSVVMYDDGRLVIDFEE